MEFAYNNNYHTSIKMTMFEVLYGRKCQSLIRWFKPRKAKLIRLDLVEVASAKVKIIRERLKVA